MSTRIMTLTDQQIETLQFQIVAIYRDAFGRLPYNKPEAEITEFAQSFLNQLDRDGYRFVGAFDSDSERLVGFAYGYDITAARWWCEYVKPALPEEVAFTWLEDSYQFVELVVDPRYQGRGIGSRLHDELLREVPQDRAVLSTLQGQTAAHRLYRRRGWIVLREDLVFPGVDRRYQIMGLELKRGSARVGTEVQVP
jgi:ribosomal protein S18 acetylase RimI-like enzyme